jgi:hypothetical protein
VKQNETTYQSFFLSSILLLTPDNQNKYKSADLSGVKQLI